MEIKVLKNEEFTLSGSGVLRAFQNEKMPSLDLLIREAIQNSMDARREDKNFVREEINVDEFDIHSLAKFFPQIETSLILKSEVGFNKYISISDKNTIGLTGPIRLQDIEDVNWGRFLSLVKGIAKPQENQGAGGSWGYGKTVYYRIGIGLVIFYSRIYENNEYKNRLMACLVENEKDVDSILNHTSKYNLKTGVAWWGAKDDKYENNVIPIEDEVKIQNILNCFNLKLYEGDETGTNIIIPFVNEKKLLNNTTSRLMGDYNTPSWCNSLEEYLLTAIQKWYPTKIANSEGSSNYSTNIETNHDKISKIEVNPWLDVYVNGEHFNKKFMLPLFNVIQELYNYAIKEDYETNYDIKLEQIILRNVFTKNEPAGKLVYANLTKKDLKMLEPDNEESPYTQINNEKDQDENNSNVIIAFCRKPGMILKYSIDDEWTNNIVNPKEDMYLIALFVPNGYNEIEVIDDNKKYKIKLEEYLRASEEADHNNWTDIGELNFDNKKRIDVSGLKIINKIQKGIKSKLKNELKIQEQEQLISVGTILSRQLTKMFLPQRGFGKKSIKNKKITLEKNNIGNNFKRTKKTKIELMDLEISSENELYKRFGLNICKDDVNLDYSFKIITDNGSIDANEWEKKSSMNLPIEITKIVIDNIIYNDGSIVNINCLIDQCNNEEILFEKKITLLNKIWYGFKISVLNKNISNINGKIYYKNIESNFEVNMEREKESNDEQ